MEVETILVPEVRKLSTEESKDIQRPSMFGLSTPISKCRRKNALDDFDGIRSILSHSTLEDNWAPYVQQDGSLFYVLVKDKAGFSGTDESNRCFYFSNQTNAPEKEHNEHENTEHSKFGPKSNYIRCSKCISLQKSSHFSTHDRKLQVSGIKIVAHKLKQGDHLIDSDMNNNIIEDSFVTCDHSSHLSKCVCGDTINVEQSEESSISSKNVQSLTKSRNPFSRLSRLNRLRSKLRLE